jgi:hypothetical protein
LQAEGSDLEFGGLAGIARLPARVRLLFADARGWPAVTCCVSRRCSRSSSTSGSGRSRSRSGIGRRPRGGEYRGQSGIEETSVRVDRTNCRG